MTIIDFPAILKPMNTKTALALLLTSSLLAGCQYVPFKPYPDAQKSATEMPAVPVEEVSKEQLSLEQRIQMLEQKMQAAEPTLKKVDVIERQFKNLSLAMGEIDKKYAMTDTPAPVEAKKAPITLIKKEDKKTPVEKRVEPVSTKELAVTSVRIGEQKNNLSRVVLDTTKSAEIHYDLDNDEKILVLDVPNAKWKAIPYSELKNNVLVKSYRASMDDSGAHLAIALKQKAKVMATARLKPSGGNGHRVYIDISPLN